MWKIFIEKSCNIFLVYRFSDSFKLLYAPKEILILEEISEFKIIAVLTAISCLTFCKKIRKVQKVFFSFLTGNKPAVS